jgi:hypothetical protein
VFFERIALFSNNDINYFLFNNISISEFNYFVGEINNFLNKDNINKVLEFLANSNNNNKINSNYKKIIILVFLDLSSNNKESLKIIDSLDEDFLVDIVKNKSIYNKLSRNIRQLILDKLSKSKWISNYKSTF